MNESSEIRASYEWHFLTKHPSHYLREPFSIQLYRKWIIEETTARAEFTENLRAAALHALGDSDTMLMRQGLQALAHVGRLDDLPLLNRIIQHPNALVARDAKTCIFEIRHRPLPSQ
jgi:hypothetical protein